MFTSLITVLIVALIATVIYALPDGAPTCNIDAAAPSSLHLTRNPTVTGSIESAGFFVKFNDVDITNATSVTVQSGLNITVELTSAAALQFKGTLMIVSKAASDLAGTFRLSNEQAVDLKVNTICTSAGRSGVTHMDRNIKTSAKAIMFFDETWSDLQFDVNVVVVNNDTVGSFYYYSKYKFNVIAGPPVSAPVSPSKCGLLGLGIFCPLTFCGFFGRLLTGGDNC